MTGSRWRILESPPLSGADNMALDHALVRRAAATGESVLRIYTWREPTVSLGRHQVAREAYDMSAAAARGIRFVRRPTGGRAVLHWREVTYSVAAPLRGRVRESYEATNRLLLGALQRLGVPAELAPEGGVAARPTQAPCFASAMPGEITCAGRKLAGSAQWREGTATMQHGSILIDDDQLLLAEINRDPAPEHGDAPITLREILPDRVPSAGVIASAFREVLAVEADPLMLDDALVRETALLRAHYENDNWTWRL